MTLNPPQIGRLSVCNTTVVMQHQLPGAEIVFHTGADSFSLGDAAGVWEVMKLPPQLTLTRDDRIVATQSLNGETSQASIPSIVQGTGPSPGLPHPHPDSHIYSCAGNVALGGMTPGTTAEILRGGTLLGTAIAHDGGALVELSAAVPTSQALQARATTCGHAPVTVTLPVGDAPPIDQHRRLPAPSFGSPLMDCVEWLRIDGVVPGAGVFLKREDGSVQRWSFGTKSWLVPLARPLEDGERVFLHQAFDLCRIDGHELEQDVGPLSVRPPRLTSNWCTGVVTATDLIPGATVLFFKADGTEIGRSGASGTTCQFTVVQPNSFTLFARQELCGVISDPSNSVDAGTDPDLVDLTRPRPVIVKPIRQCQTQVRVQGQVKRGGRVEIWSHVRGMIGWRHTAATETTVAVPALLLNEKIEAHAVSCAGQAGQSDVAVALGVGDLRPPLVASPVHAGASSVTVHFVTTGARVDVYVDGRFVNGIVAEQEPVDVPVPVLAAGQQVHARQHLCDQVRKGEPVPVVAAPAPEPEDGISKVVLFNCHTSARTVSVWVFDHTTGRKTAAGSLEHNYDDWGTCPAAGEPLEVELDDGHLYEIVIVDPGAIGCDGQDDPMVAACRRDALPFLGSSSGPEFRYAVA